jgi:hypothetical protein
MPLQLIPASRADYAQTIKVDADAVAGALVGKRFPAGAEVPFAT